MGHPHGLRIRLANRSLLALLLFLASPALAQTTGRIEGRVGDPDGAPLAGAAISATSPSLQGTRGAATDERGEFRLLALPPGDYLVRVERLGFQTLEQLAVRVPLDGGVVLALTLVPEFEGEITVTTESPIVDARSTTMGADFPRKLLETLPNDRDYMQVVLLAPGAAPSGSGMTAGPSIGGATATENRVVVDGLDTTDQWFGGAGTSFPFELVEEVEVKSGGYGAELGGALAGVVNVVTRAGGNELRGSLFAYYSDSSMQEVEERTFREYDYGATLGGPIRRDRLWYFLALNPRILASELRTVQGFATEPRTESPRYAAKLTWQASDSQRFGASAFGDWDAQEDGFERNAAGLFGYRARWWRPGEILAYDGTFGSRLLLEASLGRFEFDWELHGLNDAVPYYVDRTPGTPWAIRQGCGDPAPLAGLPSVAFAPGCRGGYGVEDPWDQSRDQARLTVSWLLDRHELKLGGESRRVETAFRSRRPGPFAGPLVDDTGLVVIAGPVPGGSFSLRPGFYQLNITALETAVRTTEDALFLEDQVRVGPHLTVRLGLRADASLSTGPESDAGPYELDFDWDEMLAPRLGLTWDPGGEGRSRLYASIGRFFESVPQFVNALAFQRPSGSVFRFAYPSDGALPTYSHLGTFLADLSFLGEPQVVLPGTRPTHTDEASLGYERELRPGLALGLRGVYRRLDDAIEDFSVGDEFFLGNPKTYAVQPITGEPLAEPAIYPEAEREYRALELTLSRRLRDGWQLFASYVYSQTRGNYNGLGGTPHWTGEFDRPALTDGAWGPLRNDRPHQVKVYGSYEWPFRLTTGFAGWYLSGTPINRFGQHDDFWLSRFVEPRGDGGRTPDLWRLDLQLAYPLRLRGDGLTLDLVLDLFNVANQQVAIAVDELWTFENGDGLTPGQCGGPGTGPGTDCPLGNPHWGTPTAWQPGRVARLGLKLRW